MQLFSTKKQASHQNADLIPLVNLFNFELEMSSMRCIYHRMLKILIKWKQFIFLLLFFTTPTSRLGRRPEPEVHSCVVY